MDWYLRTPSPSSGKSLTSIWCLLAMGECMFLIIGTSPHCSKNWLTHSSWSILIIRTLPCCVVCLLLLVTSSGFTSLHFISNPRNDKKWRNCNNRKSFSVILSKNKCSCFVSACSLLFKFYRGCTMEVRISYFFSIFEQKFEVFLPRACQHTPMSRRARSEDSHLRFACGAQFSVLRRSTRKAPYLLLRSKWQFWATECGVK